MSGVIDTLTGASGRDASRASIEAAKIQAAGQTEALDYFKETEALPQQYRQEGLTTLAGVYGLPGGDPAMQQQLIDQAMASPLYTEMMAGIPAGEEAILRNASATGGLRSGTASENLAKFTTDTRNRALTQTYDRQLSGIAGLANLPSASGQISQMIAAPSATTAQGMIAGAQAIQSGNQALTQGLLGLGGAAIGAPPGTFSDIRLKENIEYLGEKNGHSWFAWDWKENDLGIEGSSEGVMAHLVYDTNPEAVSTENGFILVNYEALGFDIRGAA